MADGRQYFWYLLFFLLLCNFPGLGQNQPSFWFNHLNKEDDLLNANIQTIFQDSEGFTWLGSESGLDRFDGHSPVHYLPDASDPHALSAGQVYGKFFEDSQKNIWFCNDASIQCYRRRNDHFSTYYVRDTRGLKIRSGYQAICLENDSLLWVRADSRTIFYFNIHTLQSSKPVTQTTLDIEVFPGITAGGTLRYLFSVDGSKSPGLEVFELDENRKVRHLFKIFTGLDSDFPALNIHSVYLEQDTVVWLSANTGLYRWNLFTKKPQLYATGNLQIKFIAPFDTTHFIVTERHVGLYLFDKTNGTFDKIECRLLQDPVRNLNQLIRKPYVDPKGNVWIILDEEGVMYAKPEKIKFRSIPKYPGFDGSTNYMFRTMIQRPDHRIWCSTLFNGIFLLEKDGTLIQHYHPGASPSYSLESRQINHMILDRRQRLWVATDKGVSFYDPATDQFVPVTDEKGAKVPYVTYLCQLQNGDIIASTLQQGIFYISEKESPFRMRQSYASSGDNDFFTTIYEDASGSIYISRKMSEIIIFNYFRGRLQPLLTKDIKGLINGFHEDADGKTLWIATSYGLVKLDKTDLNKDYSLFVNHGDLKNNEILSLTLGRDKNLWMGASGSIVRFNPRDSRFVNFSLADGIQSSQFGALAILQHEDGTLWFGGNNGITIVNPMAVSLLKTRPKIHITEIKVNYEVLPGLSDASGRNTNVSTIDTLVREFRENTLSFSFAGIDYSDPSAIQLKYKMEGLDKDWVVLKKGEPGFARYPNLPPRTYQFKIQAANSDGEWSEEEKTLFIRIKPHWTQTWWARSLFTLLLLLIIYAGYRYRIYQIRKVEAFKRKEAEYRQLVAENETAVLRLQMKPHFIFNSMNSISNYILHKDIDTANDYLNRFAGLMRKILEQAEKPFLEIAQEIELLELYLHTEAMRFEDPIDFEFHISEDLDPDEVVIPTMILQPFLENAIWHGLSGKEGPKKIIISFERNGEQLLCSVQDNGIGRVAAAQKKRSTSSHASKAIAITQRRLKILEEMEGVTTALNFIDLTDDDGRPAGTKVTILLPFL